MATTRAMSVKNKKRMARNANAMDTLGGFTIIEVVLVLAIAGLIFLMVFIALPQLQRAQRDTQRRNDLGRLEGAITQYQTNNNGKIPDKAAIEKKATGGQTGSEFIKNYIIGANGDLETDFTDPLGSPYEFKGYDSVPGEAPSITWDGKTIHYFVQARCDGETVKKSDGKRNYAIVYKLEGSGVYCQDNAG